MNADAHSLHRITGVIVYGSYVSQDDGLVGDVDIAVGFEPRTRTTNT